MAGFPRLFALRLIVVLFGLGMAGPLAAQSLFERLVMPGPLSETHAELETECANCHTSFSQGAQDPLCLDCHKPIAADIAANEGYHGRAAEAQSQECSHCHTDHEGRDFPIVDLDREVFDHNNTDFALVGAHAVTSCESCHLPTVAFRDAPQTCIGCHREDEPHRGELGTDCADCHTTTTWTEIEDFDHAATGFVLLGGHEEVACTTCHQNEVYADLPDTCVGCHRIQDVHADRFGPKCETCHTVTTWTEVRFNHDTDTKFALTGKHEEIECNTCHTGPVETADLPLDCVGCHTADDPHNGELGPDCASCHGTEGWRQDVAFDHDLTNFPLIGLHVLVPCEGCHLDTTFHPTGESCVDCHLADDAHEAALGTECSDCHNPNGWAFWIFDHDVQTDFALTGLHVGLQCEACHAVGSLPSEVSTACIDCHRDDDKHLGRFGTACEACHTTESWTGARLQ